MKLVITTILVLLSTSAFAMKEYTVGVEGIPFLPYSDVNEKKEYIGIFKEILTDFGKKNGIKFKFSPLPIKRLYTDFYNGQVDFKIPANPYWQKDIKEKRKLDITYSNAVVDYIDGILVKSKVGNKSKLKTIGIVSGFTPWEYLGDIKNRKLKTRENPSIKGLLQQGILGRVDGVYINIAVGKEYLKKDFKKVNALVFDQSLPHTKSSYFLATTKHRKLIEKFNVYLKKSPILKKLRASITLK